MAFFNGFWGWVGGLTDHACRTLTNPPPQNPIDVPESGVNWEWDCFAAEALSALWAEDVHDEDVRFFVARLIFAPHYIAVQILFARCAERRGELGEDFERLRRLVFEFAHIQNRIFFVRQARDYCAGFTEQAVSQFGEAVDDWVHESVHAFVDGTLPLPTSDWKEMDQPKRFALVDAARAKHHARYFLDFQLIRAAHEWLPIINDASSECERRIWLDFLRSSLSFSLNCASNNEDNYSTPNEGDRWVLERVAAWLPMMRPDERPEELWQAVLNLGQRGQEWSDFFLRLFHRFALQQDPVPAEFSQLRLTIINYVLSGEKDGGEPSWSPANESWVALVGISGWTRPVWEARHQSIASASAVQLDRWTAQIAYGPHFAALADWLKNEAAAPIRLQGLLWLDRALITSGSTHVSRKEDCEEAVASLLQVVWAKDETRLRKEIEPLKAFRSLLSWLGGRQNPLALELAGRLGGLTG